MEARPQRGKNVTDHPAARRPLTFRFYYAAIVIAAASLLAVATPHAPMPPLFVCGVVLALMILVDLQPIQLPSGGSANASGVLDLPALVILGPMWTSWIVIASTLVTEGLVQRRGATRVVHNLALYTLT